MGYKISSLRSLPVIPGIELYVFILGQHNWAGGYAQIIEDNFSAIAKKLGEKGAIIAGHDGVELAKELPHLLSESALKNKTVHNFVSSGESLGLSILLLGAHPSKLDENDLFLLAPIEQIDKQFGSLDQFFSDLCNFAEERNHTFLEKFEEQQDAGFNNYFELKPNFYGIGVNINAIINRWKKR